ncbi:MAG: hypothetical protein HXY34_03510 [Candidatus Thorarchaeota archaeon]|nr:hypothetical protein [Candidatus Thorarchaeota archaeon]
METLEILRTGFVAFIDGLWWGLRDNVGALSMYEGFSSAFKQMGKEIAQLSGGKGPQDGARIAALAMNAIGLDVGQEGNKVTVRSCPIWNRILERGLEYAFHIEEICWLPMMQGIGEVVGAKPSCDASLRRIHLEKAKVEYKVSKAEEAAKQGRITQEELQKQLATLKDSLKQLPAAGGYHFG